MLRIFLGRLLMAEARDVSRMSIQRSRVTAFHVHCISDIRLPLGGRMSWATWPRIWARPTNQFGLTQGVEETSFECSIRFRCINK